MAARLEGYTTTTAVLGGNRVQKVHEWHIYSQPSETYFEVRANVTTTKAQMQAIANGVSKTIETLLAAPDITDIAWSQDVTPAGQLRGVFTVYWYLPEKLTSGWVEVPYTQFTIDNVGQAILRDSGPGEFSLAPVG